MKTITNLVLLRVPTKLRRYYQVPIHIKSISDKFRYLKVYLGEHAGFRQEAEALQSILNLGSHLRSTVTSFLAVGCFAVVKMEVHHAAVFRKEVEALQNALKPGSQPWSSVAY